MVALLIRVEKTPQGFWAIRIGTEIVDVCEERATAERWADDYRKDIDLAAQDAYAAKLNRERRTADAIEIERLTKAEEE